MAWHLNPHSRHIFFGLRSIGNSLLFLPRLTHERVNKSIFSRLSETFDRLEIKSKLEEEMLSEHSDEIDETEYTSNESIREVTARSQRNISAESGEQYHS